MKTRGFILLFFTLLWLGPPALARTIRPSSMPDSIYNKEVFQNFQNKFNEAIEYYLNSGGDTLLANKYCEYFNSHLNTYARRSSKINRGTTISSLLSPSLIERSIVKFIENIKYLPRKQEDPIISKFQISSIITPFSPYYFKNMGTNQQANSGNFKKAIETQTEILAEMENLENVNQLDYIQAVNNLVKFHLYAGNYVDAIRNVEKSIIATENFYGKDHLKSIETLSTLASCYNNIGSYSEAKQIIENILKISGIEVHFDNADFIPVMSNIASIYSSIGNSSRAIEFGERIKKLLEKGSKYKNIRYVSEISNLANYYYQDNQQDKAKYFIYASLEIIDSLYGEKHPTKAIILRNLAEIHSESGDKEMAINLVNGALSIQEATIGKNHPEYAKTSRKLASLYYQKGDEDNLEKTIASTNSLFSDYIRKNFSLMTSMERQSFWNKEKDWFENEVNIYAEKFPSVSNISNAYNATLLSKGVILENDKEFSVLLNESGDTEIAEIVEDLGETRKLIEFFLSYGVEEYAVNIDSLERRADFLEIELIEKSKLYGDYTQNMSISWSDVQRHLTQNDVAIEFVAYPDEKGEMVYGAFVLTKEMANPHYTFICTESELEHIPPHSYYTSHTLSNLIWGTLEPYIKTAKNLYFSPAGNLYNIALESVPSYDGKGLISDKFNIYRLSSTRNLAKEKVGTQIKEAALYGGMNYDEDSNILIEDKTGINKDYFRDVSFYVVADSLNLRNGATALPATKIEVENIHSKMLLSGINPNLYIGNKGTEASFKEHSGKKTNIMHIATHGFYWTEKDVRKLPFRLDFLNVTDLELPVYMEDKALSRSGLLFSGANNALKGKTLPENAQDGILTAKEIAGLDLRGLELVVLSACETGLGEITSQGVFGLQRGFKKAGANTLLMSLWKVDDNATQLLMERFYEEYLKGNSTYNSLKIAQSYVREYEKEIEVDLNANLTANQRRQKERRGETIGPNKVKKNIKAYSDPKYWAGFILLDALN